MSDHQLREDQGLSGTMEKSGEVSSAEFEALRGEVMKEMNTEEENLSLISRHDQRARRLIPLLVGLLVVNAILIFILPHYFVSWIVASFFVYMYYFIVLLFPTTRRVRTPAEKKKGLKARRKRGQGAKGVIMRGKKAVVIAFWNSFFIGTQTLAKGIALILIITITFAFLGLAFGTLDLFSTTIVVIQAIAILGYYYVIIHYRPYSKDFLRTVARVRRDKRMAARWQTYLKGVFIVVVLLTIFAIFLVSAIFLPGRSIDAVLSRINQEFALALLGLVFIFASQFVSIRYIQGFDSARVTTQFIRNKLDFLRNDILSGLDGLETESEGAEKDAKYGALRTRFLVSRIYKIAYKDLFGILPTYPIIVDFGSVLEKDVADSLGEDIPLDIPSGQPV